MDNSSVGGADVNVAVPQASSYIDVRERTQKIMRLYLKWTIGGLKTNIEARELASFIEARWAGTRPLGSPPGEVYTGWTAVAGRVCGAKIL